MCKLKTISRCLALALFALTTAGVTSPSFASSASGIDTENGQSLLLSDGGVQIMSLTPSQIITTLNGVDVMTMDSSASINLNLSQGLGINLGTAQPQAALDVNGFIRLRGSAVVGERCSLTGLMAIDPSGAVLSCNGNYTWQNQSRPALAEKEAITCEIGSGATGPCSSGANSGNIQRTTQNNHDLCTLNVVAGWAGGLWGQCSISGTPGNKWTVTASNHSGQQTICGMTCYDFQ